MEIFHNRRMRERLMAAQMPAEEPAEETGENEEAGRKRKQAVGMRAAKEMQGNRDKRLN